MDTGRDTLRKCSLIAVLALFLLLIASFVFYKERVLFADAAFVAFNIINYHSLSIQAQRYGSFITQLVPYLGQALGLPIRIILLGYAVSFNLFYFLVAAILHRLKQYGFTVLLALYYFLLVSDSFFWLSTEIHQAIAWMFLLFGVVLYLGKKQANMVITVAVFSLLAFITIFTHFIVIIPTVFLWVYLLLEKKQWPFSKKATTLFSLIIPVIICIKFFTVKAGYDDEHLRGITHFSLRDVILSFSTPVVSTFVHRCLVNYWAAPVTLIAGIISLLRNKQRQLAAWTIICCIGYFILMGLTYASLDEHVRLFHIEAEWQTLAILAAAPFVFAFLPRLKPAAATGILLLIFVIRLAYISSSISSFSWRSQFREQVFRQMNKKHITKLALKANDEIYSKYILDWACCYESLMSSASRKDNPQLTFFFLHADDTQAIMQVTGVNSYLTPYGTMRYKDLDKRYFAIDTIHPYTVMTSEELFK
jgi:hypothetical protein